MHKRPFLWSALFFCAGLLLPAPELPWPCWALCGFTALAGAIALCWAGRTGPSRSTTVWLAAGFLAAGRTAMLVSGLAEPFDLATVMRGHPAAFEQGVTLAGMVVAPPRPGPLGTDLLVDVTSIRLGRITHTVRGRLRLRVDPGPDGTTTPITVARGDGLETFARLMLPRPAGNPGAFDHGRYLSARGIDVLGSVKSHRLIQPHMRRPPPPGLSFLRRIDGIRSAILSRIDRAYGSDSAGRRYAAVCAALLLGERTALTSEDESRLAEAGLSHLLAVSGFNVAVLATVLHLLTRTLGASRRMAAATVIPVLLVYLLLNRDESSVVRAVVMAVTMLGGALIWRRIDPANALGLAALIILVVLPDQIHDAGFQLTFAATISLIVITPLWLPSKDMRGITGRRRAVHWLVTALIVTLVATIGTLPLTILHFNRVTPGAIAANLVAGPLMAAAFVGAGVIVVSAPVSAQVSHVTASVTALLIGTTFRTAEIVRWVPFMTYRRITPGPVLIVFYYLSLLMLVAGHARVAAARVTIAWRVFAYGLCALILVLPIDARRPPAGLRVTVLDVGQGDAILVETPGGSRVLVDTGGTARGEFDVGERIVAPALWAMGISRIDCLAITHSDVDHAGGAAAIARGFRPERIWLPAGAARLPPRRAITRLRRAADELDIPIVELAGGEVRCLRGACVKVLHPPRDTTARVSNEGSLVLSISSHGRRALLAGDAGAGTEAVLAGMLPRFGFLKVGHHGSRTSSSSEFLSAVQPDIAVISCGHRNRFGHPDPGVLERLARHHARVCRTDRHGAVSVELLAIPRSATVVASECLFSRERMPSQISGEKWTRDETKNQDDEGGDRHQDTSGRETP